MLNQTEQIANYLSFKKPDDSQQFQKMDIAQLYYCIVEMHEPNTLPIPCDLYNIDWNIYVTQDIHRIINNLSLFEFSKFTNKDTRSHIEFYKSL